MKVTRTFELKSKDGVKTRITITAANITGAEQNLVILYEDLHLVAVIELQPGIDRNELLNTTGTFLRNAAAAKR